MKKAFRNLIKALVLSMALFIVALMLNSWWIHKDDPSIYYPCRGLSSDIPWQECADYYIDEENWTLDEVLNGILIDKDGHRLKS